MYVKFQDVLVWTETVVAMATATQLFTIVRVTKAGQEKRVISQTVPELQIVLTEDSAMFYYKSQRARIVV